jgi:hypothetical protein
MRNAKGKENFATPVALVALLQSFAGNPNVALAAVSTLTPLAFVQVGTYAGYRNVSGADR